MLSKIKEFLLTMLADLVVELPSIAGLVLLGFFAYGIYAAYQEMGNYCDNFPERCEEIKEAHPMIFGDGKNKDTKRDHGIDKPCKIFDTCHLYEDDEEEESDKEEEAETEDKPKIPYDPDRVMV